MISAPPPSAPGPSAMGLGQGLAHAGPWQGAGHVSGFGDRGTRRARGRDRGGEWMGRARRHPKVTHPKTPSGAQGLFGKLEPGVLGALHIPLVPQAPQLDAKAFQSPRVLPAMTHPKGLLFSPLNPTEPVASCLPPPPPSQLWGLWGHPWSATTAGHGDREGDTLPCLAPCCLDQMSDTAEPIFQDKSCGIRERSGTGGSVGMSRLGNLPSPWLNPFPSTGQ